MRGRLLKFFLDVLRSQDWLTAQIWGFRVHRKLLAVTWDLTSICLKKAFDGEFGPGVARFLDMGSGQVGLLGQYVKTQWPSTEVCCADFYPEFVANIAFNAERNGLDLKTLQSDLFANVKGTFDAISFNPPYVAGDDAPGVQYPRIRFGGADGGGTTRRFLAGAKEFLTPAGRIYLGINCYYLPQPACERMIAEHGYEIEKVYQRRMNTARAFVLRRGSNAPH